MKTTFEITKEQILDLVNCSNKIKVDYRLKEWFPQAFQSELKTGKWYKSNLLEEKLYCFTKFEQCDGCVKRYYYGFSEGVWRLDYTASNELDESWTPATDKEVETALIAEAKRRGFINGVTFKSIDYSFNNVKIIDDFLKFDFNNNDLYLKVAGKAGQRYRSVFLKGKWAEIISEPIELTLEQRIERIEEQLKIKK